jgi:hypothetical protein
MYYLSTLLTRQNQMNLLKRATRRTAGSWTLKVVVETKERKRAKAGEQMLILFRMFNPQVTGI